MDFPPDRRVTQTLCLASPFSEQKSRRFFPLRPLYGPPTTGWFSLDIPVSLLIVFPRLLVIEFFSRSWYSCLLPPSSTHPSRPRCGSTTDSPSLSFGILARCQHSLPSAFDRFFWFENRPSLPLQTFSSFSLPCCSTQKDGSRPLRSNLDTSPLFFALFLIKRFPIEVWPTFCKFGS